MGRGLRIGYQAGASYTTNFDATENPLSESGAWAQGGGTTGLDWRDARSSGGIAFASGSNAADYADSVSLLSGFAANQRITGTIYLVGGAGPGAGDSHEVELMLRGTYGAHTQAVYECLVGYNSTDWYMDIVKHTSTYGDFASISSFVAPTPTIANGDIFMAEIIGTTINSYINGVKILTATDSTHSTGQPGIGFFWRGTENANDFGFTSITAVDV